MNRHLVLSLVVAIVFLISAGVAWANHDMLMTTVSGVAAALFGLRALLMLKRRTPDA